MSKQKLHARNEYEHHYFDLFLLSQYLNLFSSVLITCECILFYSSVDKHFTLYQFYPLSTVAEESLIKTAIIIYLINNLFSLVTAESI